MVNSFYRILKQVGVNTNFCSFKYGLYAKPYSHFLTGFAVENTGDVVYVSDLVYPLFFKYPGYFVLSYCSNRLFVDVRSRTPKEIVELLSDHIDKRAFEVDRNYSIEKFLNMLIKVRKNEGTSYRIYGDYEMVFSYAGILAGEYESARRLLTQCCPLIKGKVAKTSCREILNLLDLDPDMAVTQLLEWEERTKKILNL